MYNARNILFLVLLLAIFMACKEDVKDVVKITGNPEKIPTMITKDVKTLISDSGITQYRITSKIWYVFQEAKKPYWKFPTGLFLEKFDPQFKTEASIKCDSATYFKDDQIWRLDGHVVIKNVHKELILTQQLFWNQKTQKVYSDSFIHIEKADRIIEGYGFESNEKMTNYNLRKPSGIFPVQENAMGGGRTAPSGYDVTPARGYAGTPAGGGQNNQPQQANTTTMTELKTTPHKK